MAVFFYLPYYLAMIALVVIIAVLLALLIALLLISRYLCLFEIKRKEVPLSGDKFVPEKEKSGKLSAAENQAMLDERVKELDKLPSEACSIVSNDGLRLAGLLYPAPSHRYAISVHGYQGSKEQMKEYASYFRQWGCNVLLPDDRAHGESEGKYITMGWKDREDVLQWIDWIIARDPDAEIFLHGVSMGGATVMMVSGEKLPGNVKAIVEDCGYSSVWAINADEIKEIAHLPLYPFAPVVDLFFKHYVGVSGKKASSLKAVAASEVPMLFIHGDNDHFVRYSMLEDNYNAKTKGYKEKLSVSGASHAQSHLIAPDLYFSTIKSFLAKAGLD